MNPQSLRDPKAEKAVVDPLETLWAKYQRLDAADKAACDAFSEAEDKYFASHPSGSLTAKANKAARAKAGLPALEKAVAEASNRADAVLEKIASARATSLEGVMIKLRAVAEWNRAEPSDPVIEGVKTALRDFERLTQPAGTDPDDPFPALLADWEAALIILKRAHDPIDDDAVEAAYEQINPVEDKIIETTAQTITGVVAKLRVLAYHVEAGGTPPGDLATTALAGAEHVMAGPGAAVEGVVADPLVALWVEWDSQKNSKAPSDLNEDAKEAFNAKAGDRMGALEVQIISARPETLDGMRVQFLIAQFFTTDGTSDEAVPALADLKEYTERALTGIAVQGAAS